jgi:hypothetical protein
MLRAASGRLELRAELRRPAARTRMTADLPEPSVGEARSAGAAARRVARMYRLRLLTPCGQEQSRRSRAQDRRRRPRGGARRRVVGPVARPSAVTLWMVILPAGIGCQREPVDRAPRAPSGVESGPAPAAPRGPRSVSWDSATRSPPAQSVLPALLLRTHRTTGAWDESLTEPEFARRSRHGCASRV